VVIPKFTEYQVIRPGKFSSSGMAFSGLVIHAAWFTESFLQGPYVLVLCGPRLQCYHEISMKGFGMMHEMHFI
jgi:hypothetical protein